MGTNYYRVNIPSEDQIRQMYNFIADRKFKSKRGYFDSNGNIIPDNAITCLTDLVEESTKEIHICKMSIGWMTCFDHNWGKYYQPNKKSLEKFLKEPNTKIIDEYGETISVEEFWNLVDKRDSTIVNGHKPWCSEDYQRYRESKGERREYLCREDINKCIELFGIQDPKSNDFKIDGLRFAVYSDFS